MERAVVALRLDVHGRVAGEDTVLHRLLDAPLHRRDILPRDGAADDGVLELVSAAALHRRELHPAVAELPAPAGLLLVPPVLLDSTLDRLLVRHLDFFRDHV